MTKSFDFGLQAVQQLKEVVRLVLREEEFPNLAPRQRPQQDIFRLCKLDAELTAPTNVYTNPSTALATIYYYDSNGDVVVDGDAEQITITNRIDGLTIPSASLIMVSNYGGEWWPFNGNGGGTGIIRFSVLTVDCSICTGTGTVLSRPLGMPTVQGEVAGVVTVYDFAGCYLNAPSADLIGKQGFAAYIDGGVGDCGVDPDIVGRWEIFSLCCAEEECP
jgi:hypothetical protein